MKPRRIALISPCGWGNLGDAAILDSAILNMQQRDESLQFIGLTLNPSDTRRRHEIESMSVCGYSKENYGVALGPDANQEIERSERHKVEAGPDESHTDHVEIGYASRIRWQLKQVPIFVSLARSLRRFRRKADPLLGELNHMRRSLTLLGSIDMVVVAGGGQIDDLWGGPFGHPYVLFRWAMLARLKRVPFLMLSVGVGQLKSRLSRFLFGRAISLSAYRSYRDPGSRDLLAFATVTRNDQIVPDLAFAHSMATRRYAFAGRAVGVSPISYKAPKSWPNSDDAYFERYVRSMAELVAGLVARKCEVTLFCSVRGDEYVLERILSHLDKPVRRQIACPVVTTVNDLAQVLAGVSVVVASRLHALLLSSLAGRPSVALSFDRKVQDLMQTLEASGECLPIEEFQVSSVEVLVEKQLEDYESVSARIRAIVHQNKELVEAQFDAVLS